MNRTTEPTEGVLRRRGDGLTLLCLGMAVFLLLGMALASTASNAAIDFKVLYYSTRCLLHGGDPYNAAAVERAYRAEETKPTTDPVQLEVITHPIYLPTALLASAPLALLGWKLAHLVWLGLIAAGLALAALETWRAAAAWAPATAGGLLGLLLVNASLLLLLANAAGVATALAAVAVCWFAREERRWPGVALLTVSLMLKPHDAGLVWLALLLAGGAYRRRALETLAASATLVVASAVWMWAAAPGWLAELRMNLSGGTAFGKLNDPGEATLATKNPNMVIDLQAALAVWWRDARIYNAVALAICAAMLAVWAWGAWRLRASREGLWLSLAAAAPLTLLSTYHRPHDAPLLMLAMPGCALAMRSGGWLGRVLPFTACLAFLMTGTIPLALVVDAASKLGLDAGTIAGRIAITLATRPASLALLALTLAALTALTRTARAAATS